MFDSGVWKGRGIDGPPPASASLHGLRPQTVLRRTIDPSPSSVFSGAERCPDRALGDGPGMLFERVRDQTGGIHRRDRRVETRSGVLAKPTAASVTRSLQPSALPHELDRPMSVIQ